jgi:dTDP-4-dehydrorhamnose 3,5-epimerase
MEFNKELAIKHTPISGLYIYDLKVINDNRGWFKENYQAAKILALQDLNNFKIVQNNISFNEKKGTVRGLHAEPYNKFVSIAKGKVLGV